MFTGSFPRVLRLLLSQKTFLRFKVSTPPSKGTPTGKIPSNILMPADDEELCIAELSDYQAVMGIDPNIHMGLDRLPYHYPSYVHGPGVRAFIYKKGNKVIGFASIHLVDGGLTLTGLAGRLAPDCRTGGIYSRFARSIFQQYRGLPDLHYIAQTITIDNTLFNRRRKMKTDETKVLEKLGKVWDMDTHILDGSLIQPPLVHEVRELSRKDVHTMLSLDPKQLHHLFPQGRLLGSPRMSPCRIMISNLDIILKEDNVFLASGETYPPTRKDSLFPGTLLTYSSFYYCKRGVCYTIDVCGTGSIDELRAHFHWHLSRLARVSEGGGAVMLITFPEHMRDAIEGLSDVMPLTGSSASHHTVVETLFPH